MRAKRILPDEQLKLIMECRQSGLSDYQWCQLNDIKPGTFYNWISRLHKRGIKVPSTSVSKENKQVILQQEVVKIDLISEASSMSSPISAKQQACVGSNSSKKETPAIEILIGSTTIRFFNSTDKSLMETALLCLGGNLYAG